MKNKSYYSIAEVTRAWERGISDLSFLLFFQRSLGVMSLKLKQLLVLFAWSDDNDKRI